MSPETFKALVVDQQLIDATLVAVDGLLKRLHRGLDLGERPRRRVVEAADAEEQHAHPADLGQPIGLPGHQAVRDRAGDVGT